MARSNWKNKNDTPLLPNVSETRDRRRNWRRCTSRNVLASAFAFVGCKPIGTVPSLGWDEVGNRRQITLLPRKGHVCWRGRGESIPRIDRREFSYCSLHQYLNTQMGDQAVSFFSLLCSIHGACILFIHSNHFPHLSLGLQYLDTVSCCFFRAS